MSRKHVVPVAAVVVLLLVAGLGYGGWLWWRAARTSDLERAIELAPSDAARYAWTDWAGVRAELGSDDLGVLLDQGFDRDLISASTMVESAEPLDEQLGLSPATVSWELLAQAETGAVTVLGVPSMDRDELGDRLESAGWVRPDESDGVWNRDPGSLAQDGISAIFGNVVVDDGVLVAGDSPGYVSDLGSEGSQEPSAGLVDAADAAGEPLSAVLLGGQQVCSELAMAHADPGDQEIARELVADAGEISPLSGFALAAQPGGDVRGVLAFESEDQARENADARAVLASGPAPGQGGTFRDRFTLDEVRAEGRVVTLEMRPVAGASIVSDLSSGPVLFATC